MSWLVCMLFANYICSNIRPCNALFLGSVFNHLLPFCHMQAFIPHFHPLSLICTCASEDGKGLQWRGFRWRIDGQWLWSQITRYTCFALHDFLLLFLATVDNKKCYKTLLTRKQNTDGMLNVKHLGMVIDSGLKSYFVPSEFSWESGKGTAGNAAQVARVNFASYQKRSLCWEVAGSVEVEH